MTKTTKKDDDKARPASRQEEEEEDAFFVLPTPSHQTSDVPSTFSRSPIYTAVSSSITKLVRIPPPS